MEDEKLVNNSILTAGLQNNGHSSIVINGTSSNGSSYENALKKLVHILKLKASDNLKQLEDLWDSINAPPPPQSSISTNGSANNHVVNSKMGSNQAKSMSSNGSLSPRTTPSPPLSNSSCSNSSTISESSSSSSPTSSSSSPSPPRISANKLKQPPSPNRTTVTKSEQPSNNLKRDASKLTTSAAQSTSEQEAKKPKLNASGNSSTSITSKKVETTPAAKATGVTGVKSATTSVAKKDDKAIKTSTTTTSKPTASNSTKILKSVSQSKQPSQADKSADSTKASSSTESSAVSKENGPLDTSSTNKPKRDISETERTSSLELASLAGKDELNKLEEGNSIEITFDDNHGMSSSNTASALDSTSLTTQLSSSVNGIIQSGAPSASLSSLVDSQPGNKRVKLDLDISNSSTTSQFTDYGATSNGGENVQMDFDDMLTGLSCSVCKKFNQETNNKLIECRNCKYMFHQLCHRPPLTPEELEEQYISKCFECTNTATSDSESSSLVSAMSRDGSTEEPETRNGSSSSNSKESSSSILFKKDLLTNETALQNSSNTNKGQLTAMKGLAALATKFNPNQSAQVPVASNKNHELLNKFKQSASSNSLAPVSSPNDSNLLVKSKSPFVNSQTVQSTSQQQKRNIFNITSTNNSTNAIPVSVPTSDKRAK